MDKYVVGSVADLISNKSVGKSQANKKFELNSKDQSKESAVNHDRESLKSTTISSYINSKSKSSSNSLDSCSVKSLLPKKESLSKSKKNVDHASNSKTPSKKIKKSYEEFVPSTIDYEQETHEERNIDFLSLDHLPSDSEEDQDLEKNLKKKKSNDFIKETYLRDNNVNTIFVGNIPINFDKQKICKVFSKFGEIQSARIRCVPVKSINMSKKVAAIKKKFNPKRNSLVAYVRYKSQNSANAALKANGMIIDKHHLRVDFAEQIKERDNNKAVFVGGLPFDIEDDELWEFFQNCGEINSVRIIRDSQTSIGKGFGYVNFDSTASVELALQLNGQELRKRTINIKRCLKSRKKNKLNFFGEKKSNKITNQLPCKKEKKFKEKKKLKKENNEFAKDFQGKTANIKQKKKKKLSKAALRQRKLVKILGAS